MRDLIVHFFQRKNIHKNMRILIITSWLVLVAPVLSYAAGDTNEFTLFTSRADGQKSEWKISESRVLATPEWKPGAKSISLSPDKAWQIAREWCLKHDFGESDLASLWIQPFPRTGVGSRFYYSIRCHNPAHSHFMEVVVLLDGSVLEPHQVSDLAQAGNFDSVKLSPDSKP